MATFLLTWDGGESGYAAADYQADIATTAADGEVTSSWSVGSRRGGTAAGDRVFLLRQGTKRGIVASGRLTDDVIFEDEHWDDPARTAHYANVTWDRVVDVEDRLPVEELLTNVPGHDWRHVLGSGQQLRPPTDAILEGRWRTLVAALGSAGRTPRRLPSWTWDETVLAWDLYLREYSEPVRYADGSHASVRELSEFLRSLPLHGMSGRIDPRFRNPRGVARKLQNLMWQATGHQQGSPHGSSIDVRVVAALPDVYEVHRIAQAIRAAVQHLGIDVQLPEGEDPPSSVEGLILEYTHRRRERDRKLVQRKKEEVLKRGGLLVCEACGTDVARQYDVDEGAIVECHHRLPLAAGPRHTRLADLAIVCPTRHRALHSRSRWASIGDLRSHLASGSA